MSKLHSDESFDRAMRDRYRQATQQVSPATLAQLRANRHAATRGDAVRVRGWPIGAAFGGFAAIVFAITLGLNFKPGMNVDGDAQPSTTATGHMLALAPGDLPLVTALDQDPEFYAWLASSDAQLMAME